MHSQTLQLLRWLTQLGKRSGVNPLRFDNFIKNIKFQDTIDQKQRTKFVAA